MKQKILVLGGAHIDRRGRISGDTAAGASNPGSWFEEPGGGGFNAARNLARLGFDVTMISPRGGDPIGEMVSEAADFAGIDDRPSFSSTARRRAIPRSSRATATWSLRLRTWISTACSCRGGCRSARSATPLPPPISSSSTPTCRQTRWRRSSQRAKALGKPVGAIAISPAKVGQAEAVHSRYRLSLPERGRSCRADGRAAERSVALAVTAAVTSACSGGVVTRGQRELIAFANRRVVALQPADPRGRGGCHRRRRLARGRRYLPGSCAGCRLADAVRDGRRGRGSYGSIAARRQRKSLRRIW